MYKSKREKLNKTRRRKREKKKVKKKIELQRDFVNSQFA